MEPIKSFAHGAFYIFYSLIHLSINSFLLLYKIPHHLAQIKIVCSTGEEDGGCCWLEVDPYCCYCCAPRGTYAGGLGFQKRLGWFFQLRL